MEVSGNNPIDQPGGGRLENLSQKLTEFAEKNPRITNLGRGGLQVAKTLLMGTAFVTGGAIATPLGIAAAPLGLVAAVAHRCMGKSEQNIVTGTIQAMIVSLPVAIAHAATRTAVVTGSTLYYSASPADDGSNVIASHASQVDAVFKNIMKGAFNLSPPRGEQAWTGQSIDPLNPDA